jgi:hypothetical protein
MVSLLLETSKSTLHGSSAVSYHILEKIGLTMLSCLLIRYQHLGLVEDAGAQVVDQLCQLHEQRQADHLHRHREVKVTNDQLSS